MTRLLILSNGHGEDLLASILAEPLMQRDGLDVQAFPVVGQGGAYARAGIPIVGVQQTMPTGGFILKGAGNLWKDVKGGLLSLTRRQIRDLKARRSEVDAVIALGDVYVLWLAGRYVPDVPVMFVPTAKSEYIRGHYDWEYRMMRRYAAAIFPRDEQTHRAMEERALPSEYAGNLMMDALDIAGKTFGLDLVRPVVSLLPGSRQDAYINAADLLDAATAMHTIHPDVQFLLSVAPDLDPSALESALAGAWSAQRTGEAVGQLTRQNGPSSPPVTWVQGHFGDVLDRADVVIGLAGTGNEQAAGLGKPVVTFPSRGTQFTPKFARDQKRLLGAAVSLVERDPQIVAQEAAAVLADQERYDAMAAVGRERMGGPGAAQRMADAMIARLQAVGVS